MAKSNKKADKIQELYTIRDGLIGVVQYRVVHSIGWNDGVEFPRIASAIQELMNAAFIAQTLIDSIKRGEE